MARKDQEERWRRADEAVRKALPPGVKLVRTLRGHTGWIGRIAWSPDGRILASPSGDNTIQLWDMETGERLHTLYGHDDCVVSVAFDPSGHTLASGSSDHTVKLWVPASGELFHTLKAVDLINGVAFTREGNTVVGGGGRAIELWDRGSGEQLRHLSGMRIMRCVAVDPAGGTLAAFGEDKARLWDPASGKILRSLEGSRSTFGCAFRPLGHALAATGRDGTIKLWDPSSGILLRTLEGHSSSVCSVSFSFDGQLLASKGLDNVRIWNPDAGTSLALISEPASRHWPPGLAFHPRLPILATVGSDPDTPEDECDRVIHIYELDFAVLLAQPVAPIVRYTSAKVVLVGESKVGKSYLAHRIATGDAPEEGTIKTTHGMKFWPLEPKQLSPSAIAPSGQRRDVVLWDMGGQEEYRLIHQLFLHDTTAALLLFDPTRGAGELKEVETWNKYLEKQLRGRAAVKLLVGAKLDEPTNTIDRQAVERLVKDCGFSGYYETSAINGRGLPELCEAVARAIDWDGLGKTSRPELFQRIRDEIEARRRRGEVVVAYSELQRALGEKETDEKSSAVHAVADQLATQGLARSRMASGHPVLILQVQEIERYAGSLILAARHNPRGVPALELRAITAKDFVLPGIRDHERLPREHERPVIDCTAQLLLEHGICFEHEGLLIFPSLFASAPDTASANLPHAVSLYYDFAGAIDNIYASLVAWLVLAKEFGKVRLSSDRAEFEVKDGGLCGLHKVSRPGGFAHVDVYFGADTPELRRKEFISFVEDHLAGNGVEIREHVAVKCTCGNELDEETLRRRIARGDKDVVCPVCETRHDFSEGAAEARERDPKIVEHTWALRTQIEKRRERVTNKVVAALAKAEDAKPATGPIRLLHLSDLHLTKDTPVPARLQWLLDDLQAEDGLNIDRLDYLVVSGDLTDRGSTDGFEKAYELVSGLTREFGLSAERCIFVPGNHDVVDLREAYDWRDKPDGLKDGEWVKQGDIILARNAEKYPLRLKPFSDLFFHKFLQRPYLLDAATQGIVIPFWETGIQFMALNSCWQIDQFYRKRSALHVEAVANAIHQARKQEEGARKTGLLAEDQPLLRIAVWHHAVTGAEQMKNTEFIGNLQKNGVRLVLHGDVHEMQRELVGYRHEKSVHVIGSGSFGARPEDRPESAPRLYNLLEIDRGLKSARVHTRCQPKTDGPWDGWHQWDDPDGGKGRVPYYDIAW